MKTRLNEYAKEAKTRRRCWGCQLPNEVKEEIENGVLIHRVPVRVVVDWLKSEGFENATFSKVERHMREHAK